MSNRKNKLPINLDRLSPTAPIDHEALRQLGGRPTVVVVAVSSNKPQLLLLVRPAPAEERCAYICPQGGIEKEDPTLYAAALRELYEECKVVPSLCSRPVYLGWRDHHNDRGDHKLLLGIGVRIKYQTSLTVDAANARATWVAPVAFPCLIGRCSTTKRWALLSFVQQAVAKGLMPPIPLFVQEPLIP